MDEFKSITKFKVFNTNNLWASLEAIQRLVTDKDNPLELDVIVNRKVREGLLGCERREERNICLGVSQTPNCGAEHHRRNCSVYINQCTMEHLPGNKGRRETSTTSLTS